MFQRPTIRALMLMLVLALTTGCSGKPDGKGGGTTGGTEEHSEHDKPGPHGGTIEDVNADRNHVEFKVDREAKVVRVYTLDGKGKKNFPVKARDDRLTLTIKKPAFEITLKPEKQEGDPEGQTSCFSARDDRFGGKDLFSGTIALEVDGKPWTADFEERDFKKGK
jgi:hypothetical protein